MWIALWQVRRASERQPAKSSGLNELIHRFRSLVAADDAEEEHACALRELSCRGDDEHDSIEADADFMHMGAAADGANAAAFEADPHMYEPPWAAPRTPKPAPP